MFEESNGLTGTRVLLVEDNSINQDIAKELLESEGIKVEIAGNGHEAMEKVFACNGETAFDLVIMDIQIPEMDGFETTRRIRENRRFEKLPIIAMTANSLLGEREKALEAGMNDHITKPIIPDVLFETLRRWKETGLSGKGGHQKLKPALSRACAVQGIPSIPGVCVQEGLARLGGNAENYLKLLREFPHSQNAYFPKIEQAISEKDLEKARTLIHTLKGLAGNLSINGLFGAAVNFEKALHEADWAESALLFEKLHDEFNRLSVAIKELPTPSETKFKTIPILRVRELLGELKTKLIGNDFQATRIFAELAVGFAFPPDWEPDINALKAAISRFEYEQALNILASMETKLEQIGE